MNYILFAGLVLNALAIAFILLRIPKDKANYLLLLLLGCAGVHLAAKLYIFTAVDNEAVTFRMHTGIQLAYGPLLYLFARKKSDIDFIPARMWYLFIPLIMVITLYACTSLAIAQYPEQATSVLQFYNKTVFFPIVLSHIVFGILAPIKDNLANGNISLIKGLKYILTALGFVEIALLIFGNMDADINPYIRSIIYMLLGAIPVLVLWFGQPEVIVRKEIIQNINTEESPIGISEYRKLTLDTTKHEAIFNQLETLLQEKQLYKDEDLSLEKLAATSGINRHHISETLNVFAGKTFYQYINEYRIKEVLIRLDTNTQKNTRLLAIAYDCGFKTKASFNQYFKKFTGTTPSGYIKEKAA